MKQIRLGRTGIEVGAIGFGALQIATKLNSSASTRLVHYALDTGVTFFDTALGYMDSEIKLGKALRGRRRARAIVASKAGISDPKSFARSIDDSLRRLQMDYIDIYMFHGLDRPKQFNQVFADGGLMDVMHRAQKAGRIRWIGFSGHVPAIARRSIETGVFDVVLYPLSFMNREARSKGVLAAARRRDVAFLSMKPFGGGRIHRADWAIDYVKQFAEVVPVIGFERPEQIDEVIRLYHRKIAFTAAQRAEMERFRRRVGRFFCRGCGYCMPCPQGIPIKKVTFWPVIYEQMGAKASITPHLLKAVELVEVCTRCRKCVERCPYSLDIPGMLRGNKQHILRVAQSAGL